MVAKLKSRKFWITVAAAIGFAAHGDINQALAVVLAYLGIQGAVDGFGTPAA